MITIENAMVLYGENLEPIKTNVLIQDHKIVEISPNVRKGEIIDAKGCIVAPSLINSHVHLGDSVAMDMGDGRPLAELVKPPNGLKHHILTDTPRSVMLESMKKTMWEMLRSGTTTFVDFREGGFKGINILIEASEDIPIRKIMLGRHDSFHDPLVSPILVESIAEDLLDNCDGLAPSGLGEISDSVASIITRTCKKRRKLSAIHAAESLEVQRDSVQHTGKSEVERALEIGFDLLVHLTAPINDDLDRVAKSGTPVVSCPRSNGALAVGIPPIKEMFDKGINILLGTDNLMFNSPNLLKEMEYTLKVIRGYYGEYFPPKEILKMATVNAARALNLDVGWLEEDRIADMMLIEQISEDPILSIINRTETKNIRNLIIDGEILSKL